MLNLCSQQTPLLERGSPLSSSISRFAKVLWDASITKNIKAFSIKFRISDILNSTRSTRHTINANYVEDSMWNILGRHFYITLKWNFGKRNAAKNSMATRASMRMQL